MKTKLGQECKQSVNNRKYTVSPAVECHFYVCEKIRFILSRDRKERLIVMKKYEFKTIKRKADYGRDYKKRIYYFVLFIAFQNPFSPAP